MEEEDRCKVTNRQKGLDGGNEKMITAKQC